MLLAVIALLSAAPLRAVEYIIRTDPPLPNAAVFVAGRHLGQTDSNGKLAIEGPPGQYVVQIEKDGVMYTADYIFDAELNYLPPMVIPPPPTELPFQYRIESNVAGAEIWVNGAPSGKLTRSDGSSSIQLASGTAHRVELRKEGLTSESYLLGEEARGGTIRISMGDAGGSNEPDVLLIVLAVILFGSVLLLVLALVRPRSTTGLPLVPGQAGGSPLIFDRYQIIATLGAGGVGLIYRALDLVDRSAVALKVLDIRWLADSDMVRKFLAEGQALQSIATAHPDAAVVRCLRYGREHDSLAGRPFIALELLEGETLERRLERQPVLDELTAAGIAWQIVSTLGRVHAVGILHRDLTPDNVYLKRGSLTIAGREFQGVPVAILIDFGIARLDMMTKLTMDGSIAGKPHYMSPEQCRGGNVDGRSDLYSVGVMMFQMVAGKVPFEGRDPFEVMRAHQTSPPPPLPQLVSDTYADITHRLLQKDPAQRFSSSASVLRSLESIFTASGSLPANPNLVRFPERRKSS
jgi:hypothetical protein